MSIASAPISAWDAPTWAESFSVVDDETIEYLADVGALTTADDDERIAVHLVQRDGTPPRITLAGARLSSAEASELARILTTATARLSDC